MDDNNERQQRRIEQRRKNIIRQKRKKLLFAGVVLVAIVILVILISLIVGALGKKRGKITQIGPPIPSETDTISFVPKFYDYTLPVPQTEEVGESHFSDALFIGESRMSGFEVYSLLGEADFMTSGSVNVGTIASYSFSIDDKTSNLVDRLAEKRYSSVYIMVGLNELGWLYPNVFSENYSELIGTIRNLQPTASIYIHTIIPVTEAASSGSDYINNERIEQYNAMIRELAINESVYLLDLSATLAPSGALEQDYCASNGIGLVKAGYEKWLSYLKTHTVDTSKFS